MARPLPTATFAAETMGDCDEVLDLPEDEDDYLKLDISLEAAKKNYSECGKLVPEEADTITWENYRHLYNPVVASILVELAKEKGVKYRLRDCQEIALHAIGSGKDLFMIVGTGQGKTVAYTWGIDVVRRMLDNPKLLAVVTAPLTKILTEKMTENPGDMLVQGPLFVITICGSNSACYRADDICSSRW